MSNINFLSHKAIFVFSHLVRVFVSNVIPNILGLGLGLRDQLAS